MTTNETTATDTTYILPAIGEVRGARKLSGNLDISKYEPEIVWALISQAVRLLSSNASASIKNDLEKSMEAEAAKFEEILSGKWKPGGRGPRMDDDQKARVEILAELFEKQGINAKDSKKRAKASDALTDLVRLALARKNGVPPADDVLDAEVEAQEPVITSLVAQRVELWEAERQRAEALKKAEADATKGLFG